MKIDKIRFFIGDPTHAHSSIWFAKATASGVYIGARGLGHSFKLSLHKDGTCLIGFTKEYFENLRARGVAPIDRRAWARWQRPDTPKTGAAHVATICFPTDFLKQRQELPQISKPMLLIKPAPPGHAIEVGVFYSYCRSAPAEPNASAVPMGSIDLHDGQIVTFIMRQIEMDTKVLNEKISASGFHKLKSVAESPEPGETKHGFSATLCTSPKDGEAIVIWEISGLSFHRQELNR